VEKIRIALANRGAGTAPVFAAVEGGCFHAQGLEPELIPHAGHSRSLHALIAGEADFTNAVATELIAANHRHGGDAVIIASAISRSAQQVSARPGLFTREALRGRRWGVVARNDADECAIAMTFERWGWELGRDAEIIAVGNDAPRLDLLLDPAHVDVAIMHAPEPFQALRRGWSLVEDLGQLDVAFQNSCAATTRRMMQARPDTALRYVRAYCAGVYRFRTDAAFGMEVLRKYSGETDRGVLARSWTMFARLMGGMMFPSVEGIRNAAAALHRLGAAPPPPGGIDALMDMRPVATLESEGFFLSLMGAEEAVGKAGVA